MVYLQVEDRASLTWQRWPLPFFRSARRFHLGSINVPENLVANAATRDMVICDSVLTVKLMHVIEAATKTAFGHHRFQDKEKLASDVYAMLEACHRLGDRVPPQRMGRHFLIT